MDESIINDSNKMDQLIARQGEVQDIIDRCTTYGLSAKLQLKEFKRV